MCKFLNGLIQADLFKMLAKFCTYRKLMVFFIEKSKWENIRVTLNSKPICSTWRLPEKVSKHEISHIHSLIVATMTLCIKQIFSWTAEKCLFYWMKISRGRRRVTASPQHTKADSRTVIPYNVQQDLLCSFNFNDENHLKMKFIIRFPN